jgi:hypothetical protein
VERFWEDRAALVSMRGTIACPTLSHTQFYTDYLFHQFGTKEDWDRLGAVSGDNGWTWANMRQYIQKVVTNFIYDLVRNVLMDVAH